MQEKKRSEEMKRLAENLADKLSGDLSEDEMRAVMEDHERQVAQLEDLLASEKEKQMAAMREKLKRRREEKEAAMLRKQKEEVQTWYELISVHTTREGFKNAAFIFRSTVNTNPSRKPNFSETFFKPEEFENACFSFYVNRKHFENRAFSKTMRL